MNRSIGSIVVRFSVALYLLAAGILGLSGKSSLFGGGENEIRRAVSGLFGNGGFSDFLVVAISICAVAAAALVLLEFFQIDLPFTDILVLVMAIVWVVFIVLVDVIYPIQHSRGFNFVDYIRVLATHLIILGGLVESSKMLGGA